MNPLWICHWLGKMKLLIVNSGSFFHTLSLPARTWFSISRLDFHFNLSSGRAILPASVVQLLRVGPGCSDLYTTCCISGLHSSDHFIHIVTGVTTYHKICKKNKFKMSRHMTKPTKWHVRPAKTQISLGIHPVWSVFAVCMKKHWALNCMYLLSAQWRLIRLGGCPGWPESMLGACHFVVNSIKVMRRLCLWNLLVFYQTWEKCWIKIMLWASDIKFWQLCHISMRQSPYFSKPQCGDGWND